MKTVLLITCLVTTFVLKAQLCQPDSQYQDLGIHPEDSILPTAERNVPYKYNLTIIVPKQEMSNGFEVLVDSIELFGTIGFPDWLSLECIDACIFKSADTGCAVLQGTPPATLQDTTYQMGFITKAYVRLKISPTNSFTQKDTTANYWSLSVNGATGVAHAQEELMLSHVAAANGLVYLRGNAPAAGEVDVEIFDLLGGKVSDATFFANGSFSANLPIPRLASGIYLLKVNNGQSEQNRKIFIP